jgi:transcriptional regulator with XRE-family HTH domain
LLSTLRTQQGWTLLDAAQHAGISHRIIAKLEKGRLDTSVTNLEKYLTLYGFTLAAARIEEPSSPPAQLQEKQPSLDKKGLPTW